MTVKKKKILHALTSGVDTPECVLILVKKGEAERVKIDSFPSSKEVMDQAVKDWVNLFVSEQSCGLAGILRGDFMKEALTVASATLNDLALDADAVVRF